MLGNQVWVSFLEELKKPFMGCRYLDVKQKKIFEYSGKQWISIDIVGNFGIVLIITPPKAFFVDDKKELRVAKKSDLKRFGIT